VPASRIFPDRRSHRPCRSRTERGSSHRAGRGARSAQGQGPSTPAGDGVLALGVAALLSSVAIAEWAHDLPVSARVRLGIRRRAASESTIRRILQAVDLDALDAALSGWVAARLPTPLPSRPITRVIAVHGKTARGARHLDGPAAHLLAAFDHTSGVVLGKTQVDGKSNEITAFGPLLDRIDLTDVLITADALHTQRGHAEYLHQRGGHYLWIVKPHQPRPHTQLLGLPWRQVPVAHEHRNRGHVEHRQLKLTAIAAGIGFPHARLAIQLQRRRRPIASTSFSSETISAVTDPNLAPSPREADRRSHPRALADRGTPLDPRRLLRRGPVPDPHRPRARQHSHPAQLRRLPPPASRHHTDRPSLPTHRPTPQPRPRPTHITARSTMPTPWDVEPDRLAGAVHAA